MIYDFHVHSNISDSDMSIEDTVKLAEEKNVDYLAIIDHDTLISISEAARVNSTNTINIVGGVEVSAFDYKNNARVHILGFNCNPDNKPLQKMLKSTIIQRNRASYKSIDIINEKGEMHIDIDEIKKYECREGLYKQHILHYLMDKGYDDVIFGKVREKIFGKNGYAKVEMIYPDCLDVIKAINNAGGIAVLAHPFMYNNFDYIDEMIEAGLGGIEAGHPSNDEERQEYIIKFCKENNLYITCGSDWHGGYGDSHLMDIGSVSLDDELIKPFLDVLKIL